METLYVVVGMVAAFMCGVWAARSLPDAHRRDPEPGKANTWTDPEAILKRTKELEDAIKENQEATIEQIRKDTERLRQYNEAMSYTGKPKEALRDEPVDD